ncbi:hypothetical protein IG631_12018 [Alternaria alternata]|nr:hypothetical protein IG631_12018 [Alternaria alternata]
MTNSSSSFFRFHSRSFPNLSFAKLNECDIHPASSSDSSSSCLSQALQDWQPTMKCKSHAASSSSLAPFASPLELPFVASSGSVGVTVLGAAVESADSSFDLNRERMSSADCSSFALPPAPRFLPRVVDVGTMASNSDFFLAGPVSWADVFRFMDALRSAICWFTRSSFDRFSDSGESSRGGVLALGLGGDLSADFGAGLGDGDLGGDFRDGLRMGISLVSSGAFDTGFSSPALTSLVLNLGFFAMGAESASAASSPKLSAFLPAFLLGFLGFFVSGSVRAATCTLLTMSSNGLMMISAPVTLVGYMG